jgi:hypothetical protein
MRQDRQDLRSIYQVAIALAATVAALALLTSSASAASWLPHSLVFPSGITQEKLMGVGCASTTLCTAGGQDYNGIWGAHAESGSGSSWTNQTGVTRSFGGWPNSVLNGSSCVSSTTFCMTVGSQGTSGGTPASMAQGRSGSSWTFYNTGVPGGATMSAFNSVSCVSTSWCMAAGWKMVSGTGRPFAKGFNGSTWADANAANATDAVLRGISCTSTSSCLAVGYKGSNTFAEAWNGFGWSIVAQPPVPLNALNPVLNSVSCTSPSWCMAVGTYKNSSLISQAFADIWNGTSWTQSGIASTATNVFAWGVACVATNDCWVVGEQQISGTSKPWGGERTAASWTTGSFPLAPGASGGVLTGVSCPAANHCEASGWSLFSGTPTGLIETYS